MAESISAKTAWALAKAIKGGSKKKLPNSGNATVVRVDQDGTHWVRISGSDVETPINGSITADARPGDTVQYRLEDTRISITGNATSPSVGKEYVDDKVEPVEAKVDVVAKANALLNTATERARSVADAAKSVADAVNQHFFADTSGIHVTEATQDEWDANHSGANVLINSIGQLFRDGLNNLLTLTTEGNARALTVWDGLGNAASNVRAVIGETIQLGNADSGNYMTLEDTGVHIYAMADGAEAATFDANGVGLVDDAFRLSSAKTTEDYGDESDPHVVEQVDSSMRMEQANEHYTVRSHIDTKLSTGDSTVGYTYGGFDIGLTVEDDQGEELKNAVVSLYADKTDSSFIVFADDLELHGTGDVLLTGRSFRVSDLQGGANTWSTAQGTILWSGVYYMTETQTATLSRNLSTCQTGIVLHWQAYENGSAANNSHVYSFVPKAYPAGEGMLCPMAAPNFAYVGSKYVYVYGNRVVGNTHNDATGTNNGVTYNNKHWVLTQIIAV